MYRILSIQAVLAITSALAVISCSPPAAGPLPASSGIPAGGVEQRVVSYVNASRASAGRKPLQRDALLDSLAVEHARETMKLGKLGHAGMQQRMIRANQQIGASIFAENVHSVRPSADPARQLVQEWLASAVHRKNILSSAYNKTGVGAVADSAGTLWAVQVFATAP